MKRSLKWLFGSFFILAGINHFVQTDFYVRIMPPYLRWHLELVYLSGLLEMLLGAMLLIPKFTVLAAWGLIALLIAVFPANIHMALNSDQSPSMPPLALWLRLPLQGVLIAWAYWLTRSE